MVIFEHYLLEKSCESSLRPLLTSLPRWLILIIIIRSWMILIIRSKANWNSIMTWLRDNLAPSNPKFGFSDNQAVAQLLDPAKRRIRERRLKS